MSFGINFPALLFFPRLIRFKVCRVTFGWVMVFSDGFFHQCQQPTRIQQHRPRLYLACGFHARLVEPTPAMIHRKKKKKQKNRRRKNPAQFPRSKSAKGADETFLPTCHTRHIEKGIFKNRPTEQTQEISFSFFLLGYLGPIYECDGKWILQQLKGEHLYLPTPVGRGGRPPF